MFGINPDNRQTRLLSLGKDRVLVEYDLVKSNYDELIIKEINRIEQYGVPLAMVWHPPIYRESFILTINDQVNHIEMKLLISKILSVLFLVEI